MKLPSKSTAMTAAFSTSHFPASFNRQQKQLTLKQVLAKGKAISLGLLFLFGASGLAAQGRDYSVANAHAHNDYDHPLPFFTAYTAGFGSIEADILLYRGGLYVSHDTAGIRPTNTLTSLYLDPLAKQMQKNKGYAFADSTKQLLLLIDLKTPVEPTLTALLRTLEGYPLLTEGKGLSIVLTGNRPATSTFASYPSYLFFDGDIDKSYASDALARLSLFSQDFRKYTKWKGEGAMPDSARKKIEGVVAKAHALNKPIRFWAAPDSENVWRQLMELNVDYLNTDKIAEMAAFVGRKRKASSR